MKGKIPPTLQTQLCAKCKTCNLTGQFTILHSPLIIKILLLLTILGTICSLNLNKYIHVLGSGTVLYLQASISSAYLG